MLGAVSPTTVVFFSDVCRGVRVSAAAGQACSIPFWALDDWTPTAPVDNAQIELAAIDVDPGHGDAHHVSQAKTVARAPAAQAVRRRSKL